MSDRYAFGDHPHEPERPVECERYHAEIEFDRHLLDSDNPRRVERWRIEMAAVMLDWGVPVRRAGEIARALIERLKEPL